MSKKLSALSVTALIASVFCLPVAGQVTTGTILGTVRDSSGAPVAAAKVTITDINKGTVTSYATDQTGTYNAPFLIPGTYKVVVEAQGFKRAETDNVILDVDQKARLDFALEVGELTQTMEVIATAPLVRADSAELGDVVTQRSVQMLPLNGRNFAQLVYLVPGVTPGQVGENLSGASSFNPRAASDFNALGSQANANAWLVDGIDDNEYTFNTVMVQPSVESIGEFKVLTGTFSAEFGRGAGVVSVSTRSGANDYHGELFEYLRNSYMDARNYFNPTTQRQPEFRRNQFGAAVGGRIIKDKLFFFADYYAIRALKGITFVNSVPTAAERTGDFSNYFNSKGNLITIYNPFTTQQVGNQITRQPFPNNVIPANLINPVGFNVASIYPLPTLPGSFNNYTSAANQITDDNGGNSRLDYRISDKDSMFFRYSYEYFSFTNPASGQGACCLPTPASAAQQFQLGPYVAGPQTTNLAAQGAALNETHIFSPTLLNEYRMGFARTNPYTVPSGYGLASATSLGIQGINISHFTSGLPNLNIQDFTGIASGAAFLPANPKQTNIQFEDNLSWTKGTHQMKFGFRYIRELVTPFTNTNTRGTISFNDNFTNNPVNAVGGSGIATLLLGYSTGGSRGFLITPYYMTNQEFAGFFQDDWKATSRLTFNLGLRYDVFTPDVEIRNRLVNFNFNTLSLVYAGVNGTSDTAGVQTRYNDLAPRFGFAYDLTGKQTTILRGGFAISYFPGPFSGSNELGQQVPYTISQNYAVNTYPLSFTNVPQIQNLFPPIAPIQPMNTAELNAASPAVIGHQFNNLTPYMESWNIDIEHQISSSTMLEVAYAGSRGVHLTYCYNPNEVLPGTPGVDSASSLASRRIIQPLNNVSNMTQCDERNMSNYHGLQVKVTKHYSHGMSALLSYTYSRSLDYGGSAASGGGAVGNPQTITNLAAGYGPSGFDQMHRFVGSYTYELPFGKGRKWLQQGIASYILGGWEVDGIVTFASGLPFTVYLNSGVNFGAPSWPNRIASGTLSNPQQSLWFNPAAFKAPPPNTYGNSARGVLYGPTTSNWDLSMLRHIPIWERISMELRMDFFNAFNTPNFGFPNANIGSPTVGVITSTVNDNRDLQASVRIVF